MALLEDDENYSDGVDRKQLAHIKKCFITLNKQRYDRTLSGLSERQQQFLILLPLFFHVNHPMLPGYVNQTAPFGIDGYTPTKDEIRIAKILVRSFTYQQDLLDKKNAIDALFVMGSLGSVAHSDISDIDVWVCHQSQLQQNELTALQEKCNQLSRWAADVIHIEANFFLMDAEKFSQGKHATLSSESSGTAQHFLLLDEFYRTAIWLAGKIPLWWYVPSEHEKNYKAYSENLLTKRFVREKDVIDFGSIAHIPGNEFVGAGVWQLYKGIDAPYKSVLKLLLIEIYSNEFYSEPLALDFKKKMYVVAESLQFKKNHELIPADTLDAYVLVYARLEQYLIEKNQLSRLELVRRCFYFKAGKSLSKNNKMAKKTWQRLLLESLVTKWGWNPSQLTLLDNRAYWKSPHVMAERNLLANELNQGYRLLMDLHKNNINDAAINSNELLILGRKLHAAFERKAGKIDWINPNISQDLSEPAICFLEASEDGFNVWHVYRGSQQDLLLRTTATEPIKRSRNFIELLVWCYANGILSITTKLDVISKNFVMQASQQKQLLVLLQQWLPMPLLPPQHEFFTKNAQAARLILIFNVGIEPQAERHKKGMQMLSSQGDALGYSGFKENLVLCGDIIQRNTWGEIVCRHFVSDVIVNCLLYYLRLIPPHKNTTMPELIIRCFSVGQGSTIEQRVMALWRAIINCFYSGTHDRATRFVFEMAEEYVLLQFIQQQPHLFRLKSYAKLIEKLSAPQIHFSPLVVDDFALHDKPLKLFYSMVTHSGLYLFYRINGAKAEVHVIDHKGSLFTQVFTLFNVQTLLRPLCHFIRAASERLIQEYELYPDVSLSMESLQRIHIFELVGDDKQKNSRLEPRSIGQDLSRLQFVNIFAVAEPAGANQLLFTIYCDGKEFSELEFGAALFSVVARYILSCRHLGETYPCYITDLDLSLCRDDIAPHTGVQLIHYFQIKSDLESRLTQALREL